jgi:adenylosuccinate lyase
MTKSANTNPTATSALIDPLLAVSAVDGRYRTKTSALSTIASEYGLHRFRVQAECAWFSALAACPEVPELGPLNTNQQLALDAIATNFDPAAAARIKDFEATTNHDVKAVEYFVKEEIVQIEGLADKAEFVHFACTSEDINNVAYSLMLQHARADVLLPGIDELLDAIGQLATQYANLAMLSRTHGQAASPTTLGKELQNVRARILRQRKLLAELPLLAKMNGAVGNYNAHRVAYPEVDWPQFSAQALTNMGLTPNPYTTQIEPHDTIAEFAHCLMRLNQIVLDYDRDIWSYIAIEYFGQRAVAGETGSSTMPHKVNPIDFENSEGNLGIANALLEHLASKLPVSRWQRDLSDSTALRNLGSALGHCIIAYQATLKGMSRIKVNESTITADLNNNWEVLGEAVQTVMRRFGMDQPYERLKTATRGKRLDASSYAQLLIDLDLPHEAMALLSGLTPATYVGLAPQLALEG